MAGAAPATVVPAPARADTSVTTVLVVRHAEKNPHPPGGDAGLSTRGLVRAQELVRAVGEADVAAVYVNQYGRTRLTGEPLARARGDSVRVYDANRNDLLAARLLAEHRGQTVLVVGHSDSVPDLIAALIGGPLPPGEAVGYDRLYVVTLGPGRIHRLLRLRYGSPTE